MQTDNSKTTNKKRRSWFSGLRERSVLIDAVAILFLVIGVYHGFNFYVDYRISEKLRDPLFIRELSSRVRPALVFDESGRILSDSGAFQFIKEIRVDRIVGKKTGFSIKITPASFLAVEPIIEPLDGRYYVHAQRGPGVTWLFQLDAIISIVTQESATGPRVQRFRLELITPFAK